MQPDLFADAPREMELGPGARLLPGFALAVAPALLAAIGEVAAISPFRRWETRGGTRMSVAMTNAGRVGWVSDRGGYRYDPVDPETGHRWPAFPACFAALAREAAEVAGYPGFTPDVCLVNRYEPGTRLSLHQDRDERDHRAPIVSASLGLPALFLWGGQDRADLTRRLRLLHGDVVVWGGPSRLTYHGVAPLEDGIHPATGARRYNLTFRESGRESGRAD